MAKRLLIGSKEKEIIKLVAKGIFLVSALVAPNMAKLVGELDKISAKDKIRYRDRLNKLEEKGFIYLSGEKVKLTARGRKLLAKINFEDMDINRREKWKGIWQIVSYDIPNEDRKERDFFRDKLKEWGFIRIQKSLWVAPYICKEEVAILSKSFGINNYVMYFTTSHLPNEFKYLKLFGLDEDYVPGK